ncbi:hypothetical protein [Nostocoides sp. Soil756]|uniref:hypothetical protein n=1 Tax=Nostocoides sp. Soil756 TaxID=1736399 RepID=UPI0006F6C183|nr:hypothetical protein [Tetrasphaera sp. Soil756]KRE61597.1 hypothetical protein ASG78_09575 [Tetrasphaera sp. Soil756]
MPIGRWRRSLAARRLRPGDGRPLPRFRWWQMLSRSVRTVTLARPDGGASTYAVDVRQLGDGSDGAVRARLYLDGALVWSSGLPASFPVPGGRIEVAAGTYGLKRCHLVRADGSSTPLQPHPASAEGRRARLERTHPRLSRAVGLVSALLVLVGLCVAVPQLAATISQIPQVAATVGTFDLPVHIPGAVNVAAALAAAAGSVERALRLRSTWLDDLAS